MEGEESGRTHAVNWCGAPGAAAFVAECTAVWGNVQVFKAEGWGRTVTALEWGGHVERGRRAGVE